LWQPWDVEAWSGANQDSQKLARAIISAFDAVLDAEQDAGILA